MAALIFTAIGALLIGTVTQCSGAARRAHQLIAVVDGAYR